MKTILLLSPYWKEEHRWMVSSVKLAELWQRMDYKVVAVCMGSETKVEAVSKTLVVHYRKDIFLKDPLNFGIALGFVGYVLRLIKSEKPDVIVCNKVLFWSSFGVPLLRLLGHKVLLTTDALVGMTWWPRGFLPKIIMGIGGWTMGWLILLCAQRIVFFYPQPPRLLRMLGIRKKSQVIPTGIDSATFNTCPPGRAAQRRVQHLPTVARTVSQSDPAKVGSTFKNNSRAVTVTYIGRLESVKGVDDFLAAAVPLKTNYPELVVQVVGWYKEGHPLVQKYQKEVVFTGLRLDIVEILGGTDIFVMPSYSEGLCNAIMEAMSSRCACIVSEVGGNRYLVQNGVSGFYFPPGDRASLQAHIKRLLDDPAKREALGVQARKRIEEVFDWKVVEKQYAQLFNKR